MTAKWAGVVVCALCVVSFLFDQRWCAGAYVSRRLAIATYSGCIICHDPTGGDPSITLPAERVLAWTESRRLLWIPWCGRAQGTIRVVIPLWLPFLIFAVPVALLWRSDHIATKRARRTRIGCCPHCGYDRRGLADGRLGSAAHGAQPARLTRIRSRPPAPGHAAGGIPAGAASSCRPPLPKTRR